MSTFFARLCAPCAQDLGLVVLYGSAVPLGSVLAPMGLKRGKAQELEPFDPADCVTLINMDTDDIIDVVAYNMSQDTKSAAKSVAES
jgi:hypothetical protein